MCLPVKAGLEKEMLPLDFLKAAVFIFQTVNLFLLLFQLCLKTKPDHKLIILCDLPKLNQAHVPNFQFEVLNIEFPFKLSIKCSNNDFYCKQPFKNLYKCSGKQ